MISSSISHRELALSSDVINRRIRQELELYPSELRRMSHLEAKRLVELQLERLLRTLSLIIGQPWFATDVFLRQMVEKASIIMAGDTFDPPSWDIEGFCLCTVEGHVPHLKWRLMSDGDETDVKMELNFCQAKLFEVFGRTTDMLVRIITVKRIRLSFDEQAFDWARSITLRDKVRLAAYLDQAEISQALFNTH